MIIARVRGGLGNQMFQYATAKALARRHRCPFALYVPRLKRHPDRPFALDCFTARVPLARLTDFQSFKWGLLSLPFLRRRLHPQVREERGHNFDASLVLAQPPLYLDGYWQSEMYFRDMRDELLQDFSWSTAPAERNLATLEQIEESESIAVHVRRGDYVSNPGATAHHGVLGLPYYEAAMHLAAQRSRNPLFFIFSDDIPWARDQLGRLGTCVFVDQNSGAASEDLRLMSACKHQIIANSSFSWWAAWLNKNPDKMVVAPKNWLTKPPNTFNDVFAAGWTTL